MARTPARILARLTAPCQVFSVGSRHRLTRSDQAPYPAPVRGHRERPALVALFALGTGLGVASLAYAALRRWPTFDPMATATLIGIGLLLVVIHERLGAILRELRELVSLTRAHGQRSDGHSHDPSQRDR